MTAPPARPSLTKTEEIFNYKFHSESRKLVPVREDEQISALVEGVVREVGPVAVEAGAVEDSRRGVQHLSGPPLR